MKIIFFNTFHNGDLLFTKESIRNIVNNNSTHTFYIACRQFYSLYSDIDKLQVLKRPDDVDGNIKSTDIDLTKKYYIKDGTLYLNASVAINNGTLEVPSIKFVCNSFLKKECINNWFTDIINGANTLGVEPKLIFKELNKEEFIPTVLAGFNFKDLPSELKSSMKTPCIFFYNIYATSAQTTFGDDDKNIESIASKYPSYTVIVAKETKIKMKNVLSLYDLNIREAPDGKNLLMYAYVASFCPIIVTKETGAALTIFNRDMMTSSHDQHIIIFFSEEGSKMLKREYGNTLIEALNELIIRDNKHLIPLGKYDSETLLGEIEKIGPVQPAKLALELSGGSRFTSTSKRRIKIRMTKRKILRKRKSRETKFKSTK